MKKWNNLVWPSKLSQNFLPYALHYTEKTLCSSLASDMKEPRVSDIWRNFSHGDVSHMSCSCTTANILLPCLKKGFIEWIKNLYQDIYSWPFCAFLVLSDVLKLIFPSRMCDVCKIEFLFLGLRRKFKSSISLQGLSTCTVVFAFSTRSLGFIISGHPRRQQFEWWTLGYRSQQRGQSQYNIIPTQVMLSKFSTRQRTEAEDIKIPKLRYLKPTLQRKHNL